MSLTTAIFLIGILDLFVVLAVAAIMSVPFKLDRHKDEAAIYAFAAPLPEDIAAVVAFLASDEARHITGTKMIVDGGTVNCESYRKPARGAAGQSR